MTYKSETVFKQTKLLPEIHSKPLLQFKDWLVEDEDSSLPNASNYLRVMKLFSQDLGNKDFKDVTREDVLEFLNKRKKSLDEDPEKRWVRTWNDYLARMVGFYRWLHNHQTSQAREDWKTPEPFCSIKKKKNKRYSSYTPNDVWEIDELLLAVKYCDNIRDKAILTIGWDMVSRNHELVKVKIKDIVIKEKYAEISTSWDTKTGVRTCPILVGFPYLKELLNCHPFATNPNSFLILSRTTSKPINPDSLWRITDTLKKRISKMIQDGEIVGEDKDKLVKVLQKPWNPYLMTRHSSLTEKSDILNDFQLKQYAGWAINSTRPRTYLHRKTKQMLNPLLQEHGIIEKPKPRLARQECSRCSHINTSEASLCSQCSFVLNTGAWGKTKDEEILEKNDKQEQLRKFQEMEEKIHQMQKEMVLQRSAFTLFRAQMGIPTHLSLNELESQERGRKSTLVW